MTKVDTDVDNQEPKATIHSDMAPFIGIYSASEKLH